MAAAARAEEAATPTEEAEDERYYERPEGEELEVEVEEQKERVILKGRPIFLHRDSPLRNPNEPAHSYMDEQAIARQRRAIASKRKMQLEPHEVKQQVETALKVDNLAQVTVDHLEALPAIQLLDLQQMVHGNDEAGADVMAVGALIEKAVDTWDNVDLINAVSDLTESVEQLVNDDYYDDEDDMDEVARKKAHAKEMTERIIAQINMCHSSLHGTDALSLQALNKLVEDECTTTRKKAARPDAEETVHVHLKDLERRQKILSGAVEKAGGWRSVLFLPDGSMDEDVDLEIW